MLKIYVMWQNDKKNVAIMEVTNLVDDTINEKSLDRLVVAKAIMELVEANCVITAESEEQMLELFPNAEIKYEKEMM